MTDAPTLPSPVLAARRPSTFEALTALSLALAVAGLAWGALEARELDGAPVWMKPTKFALSFLVTFATLALVEARLSPAARQGRLLRWTAGIMAACFVGEMGYIGLQAARGAASHWNYSSLATSLGYAAMGVMAVLLTLGIGAVGLAAARDREARLSPALRRAVAAGLLAAVPLVLLTAGVLSAGSGHHVGLHPEGGRTVPLLGWSLEVGDLRPAHFLALHAMQAVPLWVLAREALGGRPSRGEVDGAAALWSALTLAAFAQALLGRPLWG